MSTSCAGFLISFLTKKGCKLLEPLRHTEVNQEFVVRVVLPGSVAAVAVIHDWLSAIRFPKGVRALLSSIASPFHNFLTLEDLDDVDAPLPQPVWKTRTLSFLALANAVGWLAYLAYVCILEDGGSVVEGLVTSISWVRRTCTVSC